MGYMTKFYFDFNRRSDEDEVLVEKFKRRLSEISKLPYEILNEMDEDYAESKWYNCKTDILKACEEFPEIEFNLEAMGEARQDWWVIIKHRGKEPTYSAAIIVNPFETGKRDRLADYLITARRDRIE